MTKKKLTLNGILSTIELHFIYGEYNELFIHVYKYNYLCSFCKLVKRKKILKYFLTMYGHKVAIKMAIKWP